MHPLTFHSNTQHTRMFMQPTAAAATTKRLPAAQQARSLRRSGANVRCVHQESISTQHDTLGELLLLVLLPRIERLHADVSTHSACNMRVGHSHRILKPSCENENVSRVSPSSRRVLPSFGTLMYSLSTLTSSSAAKGDRPLVVAGSTITTTHTMSVTTCHERDRPIRSNGITATVRARTVRARLSSACTPARRRVCEPQWVAACAKTTTLHRARTQRVDLTCVAHTTASGRPLVSPASTCQLTSPRALDLQ
jgi:hypothetical protein